MTSAVKSKTGARKPVIVPVAEAEPRFTIEVTAKQWAAIQALDGLVEHLDDLLVATQDYRAKAGARARHGKTLVTPKGKKPVWYKGLSEAVLLSRSWDMTRALGEVKRAVAAYKA